MDMQNVSNLVIPEGEVRTIHDEDSRLLWGRVSYDVKYSGDAAQDGTPTPDAPVTIQTATGVQTVKVCGKNLLKIPDGSFTSQGLSVKRLNNTITVSGKYTGSNNYKSLLNSSGTTVNLDRVLPAGTYTISISQVPAKRLEFSLYNSSNVRICHEYLDGTYSTFTLTEKATGIRLFINGLSNNLDVNSNYTNLQIEAGTAPTAYEPYQSQSYTVDLGATELCKIGNYQDYIYKSGDDWCLHKVVKKDTYNGQEAWTLNANSAYAFRHIISDAIDPLAVDQNTAPSILTNTYAPIAWNSGISDRPDYCVSNNASNNTLAVRNVDYTDLTSFKTFLSTNNLIIYYPLATPIDAQITDATLISQLDAIHQFLTRYGYNSTVSGNLPLIISKTNL